MARRSHPIHAVVEREFGGYSSNDIGRSPPNSAITGRLDGGGDEAEKEHYQDCMVEVPLEDPAINELERMNEWFFKFCQFQVLLYTAQKFTEFL